MKIGQILSKIKSHPYLTISKDAPLEKVAEEVAKNPQVRSIYVVDEKGRLVGLLSLGELIRTVTAMKRRSELASRNLLECVTCQQISDIMNEDVLKAGKDDDLERILDLMVNNDIKEIPLVDEQGRLIGNIGILDLWLLSEEHQQHRGCFY